MRPENSYVCMALLVLQKYVRPGMNPPAFSLAWVLRTCLKAQNHLARRRYRKWARPTVRRGWMWQWVTLPKAR